MKINHKTREQQLIKAQDYAKQMGGKCLSTTYVHARTAMQWKCANKEHPQWTASYEKLALLKRWCPLCGIEKCAKANTNHNGLKMAQDYAISKGGKCLSTHYVNAQGKLTWKCSDDNHPTWQAIYNNVVKKGRWCKQCSSKRNLSENRVRLFFETFFGLAFPSSFPSWNRNPWTGRPLELDGYCKEFNLAFEHDGIHHFELNVFNRQSKKSDLTYQRFKDHQKELNCKRHGITLVKIPYVSLDKSNDFDAFFENIVNQCRKHGIDMRFTFKQIETIKTGFVSLNNKAP
ncbi:hypothetical protein [Serratia marcescens]|uniref:hypothetical protein n=1 Tax=Serratia marcescens TaxID=615 RepID=UPI001F14FB67|nr:hypothetical protein [Serratia marcescens]